MIARYFVEFIIFSFFGWIWECLYCTFRKKKWENRGVLFGPICPIYGSAVLMADIVFHYVFVPKEGGLSLPVVFLICMFGSAVIEFGTHWYLERKYHATWWDYSDIPLNIQGRICVPVSIGFGAAGTAIYRYVFPLMEAASFEQVNPIVTESLAIGMAMVFGADMALTNASLTSLIPMIEAYKANFDRHVEETYLNVTSVPQRIADSVSKARETAAARSEKRKRDAAAFVESLSPSQRHALSSMKHYRFRDAEREGSAHFESLKEALRNRKKEK